MHNYKKFFKIKYRSQKYFKILLFYQQKASQGKLTLRATNLVVILPKSCNTSSITWLRGNCCGSILFSQNTFSNSVTCFEGPFFAQRIFFASLLTATEIQCFLCVNVPITTKLVKIFPNAL